MKWLAVKRVTLARVIVPGSFTKRLKQPHVKELAKSIQESGVIALPVISTANELVAGGDRFAALMLNGTKAHDMRVVEGTPRELELIQIDENLKRRQDDRDVLIKRRVELGGELPVEPTGKAGRPKTSHGAAREQVARELGSTPEAVRSAERRATAKDEPDDPSPSVNQAPPVITWGVPIDHLKEEFGAIRLAQVALKETDRHLKQAQRALTTLDGQQGSIGHALYYRLKEAVHGAADTVRRAIPDALCPYCKGMLHRRNTCSGCSGFGYVGNDALDGVAPELLKVGADAVVINGKGGFEPIASARVVRTPVKAAPKPGKKLRIEDDKGHVIEVADMEEGDLF